VIKIEDQECNWTPSGEFEGICRILDSSFVKETKVEIMDDGEILHNELIFITTEAPKIQWVALHEEFSKVNPKLIVTFSSDISCLESEEFSFTLGESDTALDTEMISSDKIQFNSNKNLILLTLPEVNGSEVTLKSYFIMDGQRKRIDERQVILPYLDEVKQNFLLII
jgi:hypothetical protein